MGNAQEPMLRQEAGRLQLVFTFLLDHGANPNGQMPLYLAVRGKNYAVFERLIRVIIAGLR